MSQEGRIDEVDILRGLAALLMILGHSFIVYPVDISGVPWCKAVQHIIYTFHMELFFVLAGVVYRCQNYKEYIMKKVKRILIPYLFFGLFTILTKAFGGLFVNGTEPLGEGVFKLIFMGGGYWFLYVLFILLAVYPFIERIYDKSWKRIVFAGVMLILGTVIELPSLFMINKLICYIPYFIFGNCIKNIIRGGADKRSIRYIWICSIVVYCVIDMIEIIGGYELRSIFTFSRAIAMIVFIYFCTCILNGLWRRNILTECIHSLFCNSSRFSMQLYLFNGYLLVFFRILICSVLHIENPFMIVLGIWTGDVCVTLIMCKWVISRIPVVCSCCGLDIKKEGVSQEIG